MTFSSEIAIILGLSVMWLGTLGVVIWQKIQHSGWSLQKKTLQETMEQTQQSEQILRGKLEELQIRHGQIQEELAVATERARTLAQQYEEGRQENQKNRDLLESERLQRVQLESEIKAHRASLEEEKKRLVEMKQQLEHSFQSMAANALEGNNRQFLELAQQVLKQESQAVRSDLEQKQSSLQGLVDPLKQSLEQYQTHVLSMEKDRQRSYQQVEAELKRVVEMSGELSSQTKALKDALSKPHIRGRWGEVQLRNCIELAGMSEHADVEFQVIERDNESGRRLIPDMVVRMPGGRSVIVDAKTPVEAFIASLEAETEEKRNLEMVRLGRHMKEHIRQLSQKDYGGQISGSADFTVMFLPNESFLYAGLEKEPDLIEFALDKKILIATPPTFIGLLKVIHYGWNEQKLTENAQKISLLGTELHKRIADFMEAYQSIGKHLERARNSYEQGAKRLESRVLVQARKMEEFGARSHKSLPESTDSLM